MTNISLVTREFKGVKISQRADGFLDATAMCKATGKRWFDYYRLDSTQAFVDALSSEAGYPASELIQVVKGGLPENQGTWVHPQVAINLAQWSSPEFAVLVSKWVFELLTTGHVNLQAEQTPATPDQSLVNATADALRMSTDSRLKLLHNLTKEHGLSSNLLPAYSEGRVTKALGTLLKEHNAGFGASKANKVLFALGIIEKQTRQSTKTPGQLREFWSLTEIGLEFGKNLVNHNNQRETQPHYYCDTFPELLDKINGYLAGDNVIKIAA